MHARAPVGNNSVVSDDLASITPAPSSTQVANLDLGDVFSNVDDSPLLSPASSDFTTDQILDLDLADTSPDFDDSASLVSASSFASANQVDVARAEDQRLATLGANRLVKRPRPEAVTGASMTSAAKTPRLQTYTCPVLRNIRDVSGKKTKGGRKPKGDAPLMPYVDRLEQYNKQLEDAQHRGLGTEAMKQMLDKVTQDRLETLKAAQAQLSVTQFKRLKRLLLPVAKDVEKVGAPNKVNPRFRPQLHPRF